MIASGSKMLSLIVSMALIGMGDTAAGQNGPPDDLSIGPAAAIRTNDFIDSIGVNVHVQFVPGKYANIDNVVTALEYLGLHRVRDVAPDPEKPDQASYGKLAEAGIRLDLFARGWQPCSNPWRCSMTLH
jgi:hypothetical protein